MRCAACARRLQALSDKFPNWRGEVSFPAKTLSLHLAVSQNSAAMRKQIAALSSEAARGGYDLTPEKPLTAGDAEEKKAFFNPPLVVALMAALAFLPSMVLGMQWAPPLWAALALATVVQFYCARSFYRPAFYALKSGWGNMDALVLLGTLSAYFYSLFVCIFAPFAPFYPDSAVLVIALVLLGRALESRAERLASSGMESLLSLQPETAHRLDAGKIRDVPAGNLRPGDVFVVRPGERVPADGKVTQGVSDLDQSLLSGESLPVPKAAGDEIFAGSLNQTGILEARALMVGENTFLLRIAQQVRETQASKAPAQRLADKIAAVFVPLVVLFALMALGGGLWAGLPFYAALLRMVAVLVVACPCALGLATPMAIVTGSARGARAGIVYRTAAVMEAASTVNVLAFDKTGTLTQGHPELVRWLACPPFSEESLLSLAIRMERDSEHPFAMGLRRYGEGRSDLGAGHYLGTPEEVRVLPGRGLKTRLILESGEKKVGAFVEVFLGSPGFLEEEGAVFSPEQKKWTEKERLEGRAVIGLMAGKKLMGLLAFGDALRPDARQVVQWCKNQGIETCILSGDSAPAVTRLARALHVDRSFAHLLPSQKVEKIAAFGKGGKITGMIGDGINDAAALTRADVGFTLGDATALAVEVADIVLTANRLASVCDAIALSRAVRRKIRQNLFFAFIYNIVAIPLAAFGLLGPALAAMAMGLSSISVILNAWLLSRWKPVTLQAESVPAVPGVENPAQSG